MWLIYYSVDGNKGWYKGKSKEALEEWFAKNFDVANLSCDTFYDIVDLKRMDLVEELKEANNKLAQIRKLCE